MREQSNASHASFGNMKIDPHKLDMLDARISGEGGVESSTGFEPSRFSSEYTPPRSAMSFNDDSKSQPLVSFENDGEVSQSSCQTVHAGNLKPKNKSSTDAPQPGKEQLDGNGITPPSKKKTTPSKRPASAIGDRHHTKKLATSTESDIQSKKIRTKTKPPEEAKKLEAVSASATMSESTTASAPSQKQQLHQQSEVASKTESR